MNYLIKGAHVLMPALFPEVATALSIPVIALLAVFGIRRMRQALSQEEGEATVRRVQPLDREYLRALEGTFSEWAGEVDEKAYRDL